MQRASPFVVVPLIICCACSDDLSANPQDLGIPIYTWKFRTEVLIDAKSLKTPLKDRPVLLLLDPTKFDYNHARPDGTDLRFSTSSDIEDGFDLPFWIEEWKPAGTSKLWIKLASIQPGQSTTIYLFHGHPTEITSVSALDQTFPGRFVSTGDLTLSGQQEYSWFELRKGHTVTVQAGKVLNIRAARVFIAGSVDGMGKGHLGGGEGMAGQGPGGGGGGTPPFAAGAGGGHGGAGGAGTPESGGTPAAGGKVNGDPQEISIELGSGGGGAGKVAAGGAGGGGVWIHGQAVQLAATAGIRVDGIAGKSGPFAGSGGGSGGGILITAGLFASAATLSARGGGGGPDSTKGGGGGGGGRIKIFYRRSSAQSALDTTGGKGGSSTSGGADGSSRTTQQNAVEVTATPGKETRLGSPHG
jgi:Domain of unknown function (DUF2341)